MTDKNNGIVDKHKNDIEVFAKSPSNTEATSVKIPSTKLKQNSPSDWKSFSATLTGSVEVPPADSESSVAIFGAIDDTMHFRIEARNFRNVTGVCLNVGDGNIVADLLKFGEHLIVKQGTIIRGNFTDSGLTGPLQGQSIKNLVKLIEENKVYVRISDKHDGELWGSLHRAGKQPRRFPDSSL